MIHDIYHVYAWYIRYIYCFSDPLVLQSFKEAKSILDELKMHVRCMDFQDNYLIALKRHDLLSDRIYHGFTRYIPRIYQTYTILRSLATLLSCPSVLGSLRLGLPSDLLSLGH
jgi:hypothetical protein